MRNRFVARACGAAGITGGAHPQVPIFAITPSEAVWRRLTLVRSVIPILGPMVESTDEMLRLVDRLLVAGRYVAGGEAVIVVASLPVDIAGTTNLASSSSIAWPHLAVLS